MHSMNGGACIIAITIFSKCLLIPELEGRAGRAEAAQSRPPLLSAKLLGHVQLLGSMGCQVSDLQKFPFSCKDRWVALWSWEEEG